MKDNKNEINLEEPLLGSLMKWVTYTKNLSDTNIDNEGSFIHLNSKSISPEDMIRNGVKIPLSLEPTMYSELQFAKNSPPEWLTTLNTLASQNGRIYL